MVTKQEIDAILTQAFSRVKDDMEALKTDISTLKKENELLKKQLASAPATKEAASMPLETQKETRKPSNKHLVQQHMLELIEMKKYSVPEMRTRVVEEQKLCSKATFYRYIEELKRKSIVDSVGVNEKEMLIMK